MKEHTRYTEVSTSLKSALSTLTNFFFDGKGYELDEGTSEVLQNLIRIASLNIKRSRESRTCGRETIESVKQFLLSSESQELPENVYNAVQTLYFGLIGFLDQQ